jgi:hypothetical protein
VEVPGGFLLANAQRALADQTGTTNVNLNIFNLVGQYLTETTYTDEANYDIVNRAIPDGIFLVYYRTVLEDLKEAKVSIAAEVAVGETAIAEQKNRIAIIDLLQVYAYQLLVGTFGNVPYSQALDIANINPKYDDAFTIYKDLLLRTSDDINALDANFGSFGSDDIYMGGDVSMWKKFGNSLKIKIAIMLADVDNTLAKTNIEEAYAGAFAPGEACACAYPGGTFASPVYTDIVQTGRHDWIAANTIIDVMNTLGDPRLPAYFTPTGDGTYIGGPYGESNPYSQYSHLSDIVLGETFPIVMLDYTETAFYLAEAAERGYSVGGTAADYYTYAVGSSIVHWGGTEADAAAYLSKPEVNYSSAAGTYKQKIGTQAWIAYFMRGSEAYNSWRRLDFPVLNLPPSPQTENGQIPVRFTYPVNEQTLNKTSYYEAASAIGGDLMSTKLFWDKF